MNDRESFAYVDVFVGDDWKTLVSTHSDRLPSLIVNAGPTTVTLKVAGTETVTENAVKFARDLLRNVQAFAAEVERLHARPMLIEPHELTGSAA